VGILRECREVQHLTSLSYKIGVNYFCRLSEKVLSSSIYYRQESKTKVVFVFGGSFYILNKKSGEQ
jgi:hypothetical protein